MGIQIITNKNHQKAKCILENRQIKKYWIYGIIKQETGRNRMLILGTTTTFTNYNSNKIPLA